MSGIVFDVRELTVHDGPGVRATVFLKGCPLRCLWCHNPEGLRAAPELMVTETGCTGCGRCAAPCAHEECRGLARCARSCPRGLLKIAGTRMDADDLARRMHRLAPLLVEGGVTISGGEPLTQPEFLLELLAALRPLHTIVETSGYAEEGVFRAIARACDTVYLDIKHADSAVHQRLTGVGNEPILSNLRWLQGWEKPFLVRVPLIAGCNDDEANLEATAALLADAENLPSVELMPMNPFAAAKYGAVGRTFRLEEYLASIRPLPSAEDAAGIFRRRGIACRVL